MSFSRLLWKENLHTYYAPDGQKIKKTNPGTTGGRI
jgi:hypothetical protein